ncbi:hypothetical protein OGAPHI_006827 [Ogataea philodendri]|uniref:Uncharacterized protein n=1 Tax=Ogataea philodendri TaxID=1378263 RepID=A0A9P8NXP9_9ASCO|nr:uncharacterized protein OGAPHI_006827 [Ogataea philodendri]KAH3661420.1 hypothetical protein OGAPHI_006827 [Ogataea philodendri]
MSSKQHTSGAPSSTTRASWWNLSTSAFSWADSSGVNSSLMYAMVMWNLYDARVGSGMPNALLSTCSLIGRSMSKEVSVSVLTIHSLHCSIGGSLGRSLGQPSDSLLNSCMQSNMVMCRFELGSMVILFLNRRIGNSL